MPGYCWHGPLVFLIGVDNGWAMALHDMFRLPVDAVGLAGAFAMWLIMSAAMMLPTALPAFATHDDIADYPGHRRRGAAGRGLSRCLGGFFGCCRRGATVLSRAGVLDGVWLAAALLILAGAYQFSAIKDACLSKCRQPLTFFMNHWDEGPLRMGLRLGATCLGCCWALMALGLVGGAMNLGFMALATLLMVLEKLTRGAWVPRAIGLACLTGAGYLIGGTI